MSGTAAATDEDWTVSTDDNGNSQWILRFDSTQLITADNVGVEEAKTAAASAQQVAVDTLSSQDAYRVENQFWLANAVLVTAEKNPATAESELSALSGVRQAHPNFEIEPPEPVEEQELVPEQHGASTYGLDHVNAVDVWKQFGTQGEGTSVAVLDTGIDADHPDLELAEDGWAFFDGDGNEVDTEPFDPNGHGTHVSGTVAGGDATGAHIGVAPETDLYNAKVLDDGGTWAQIIAGMEWAVEKDIDVINMSLGATAYVDRLIEPVQHATEQGTIVVSSSGNSGEETSGSPANVFESFAIGATDENRDVAGFSSGERIRTAEEWTADWLTEDWPINYYVPNVSAPGSNVLSTYPGEGYQLLSGTSMASPHVAGAVALMLSAESSLQGEIELIQELFEQTAVHGDGPDALPGIRYGEGIIDVLSALTAATDGNIVEGTVTDEAGNPLSGVEVETDFGTRAETNKDGEYSLYVGSGEWQLSAKPFGYQQQTGTVEVTTDETVSQDLELSPGVDVQLLSDLPDVIGLGESFQIAVQVANLEKLTVSLADGSDFTGESVSVTIGETELTLGEALELPEAISGQQVLTVTVSESAETGGLSLAHEFDGPGEAIPVPTGPSSVMADPADANLEIVSWDETTEIVMGETLTPFITVENTGDRTAVEALQWWLFDPEGPNVFTADFVELKGGEQATATLPIGIPDVFLEPGAVGPHGWIVGEQVVSAEAEFKGPAFVFDEVDVPDQVDYGETLEITVPVQNVGNLKGSDTLNLFFDGAFLNKASVDVSAAPGESDTATLEFDTNKVVRDRYEYFVSGTLDDGAGSVWVGPVQIPPQFADYVNDNLVVDTPGLRRAISDWREGTIETGPLREVIGAWRSGNPVA